MCRKERTVLCFTTVSRMYKASREPLNGAVEGFFRSHRCAMLVGGHVCISQICKENMEGKSFYAKGGKIFCKSHSTRH